MCMHQINVCQGNCRQVAWNQQAGWCDRVSEASLTPQDPTLLVDARQVEVSRWRCIEHTAHRDASFAGRISPHWRRSRSLDACLHCTQEALAHALSAWREGLACWHHTSMSY